jgi:hypothetical protein
MAVCLPITGGTAGSILPLELSVRFDGWRDACSVVAVKVFPRGDQLAPVPNMHVIASSPEKP